MNEVQWAAAVCKRVNRSLSGDGAKKPRFEVFCKRRLPYRHQIFSYESDGRPEAESTAYETDLLIVEHRPRGSWIPRVVIECKLESLSTHDVLTYSAKAETHKQIHPYLRYGILIGSRRDGAIPGRLVRHGAHFDFMVTWRGADPAPDESRKTMQLIREEIRASRRLEEMLLTARQHSRKRYTIIRRSLRCDVQAV